LLRLWLLQDLIAVIVHQDIVMHLPFFVEQRFGFVDDFVFFVSHLTWKDRNHFLEANSDGIEENPLVVFELIFY